MSVAAYSPASGGSGLGIGSAALLGGGALISGISSLIGGGKGANAAVQAAQVQANAALQAQNIQQAQFEQTAGNLQPFIGYGQSALPIIQQLTGTGTGTAGGVLSAPLTQLPPVATNPVGQVGTWNPTMQQLAQTPGYQFALQQGLLSTTSGSAAAGLGRSGSAMKAAEQYASGLASTTYNQQFQNWLAGQQLNLSGQTLNLQGQQVAMQGQAQAYNMLTGQAATGLSAAGALGGVATQTAQNIGQAVQAGGAATAGGITGAATAQVGGLQGATSSAGNALMYAALANQLGLNAPTPNPIQTS